MSRIGQNPLKDKIAPYAIKPIVFIVITHLPDIQDYHSERFEVVRTCLDTMRINSHLEHTFMIWDNGSNSTFREYLQYDFKPDILIQSKNIGLSAAKYSAFNMIPLSSIICYSDDDMYFENNWLAPQLELLSHFPNVSSVSGYPLHTMMNSANENTKKWAEKNAQAKHGQLIPEQWNRDFCDSVGYEYNSWKQRHIKDYDTLITYNGVSAYATSHHAQCVGYAVKLTQAMRHDNLALGPERDIDHRLDQLGLQLSTTQRLVRHIGNVYDFDIKEYAEVTQ